MYFTSINLNTESHYSLCQEELASHSVDFSQKNPITENAKIYWGTSTSYFEPYDMFKPVGGNCWLMYSDKSYIGMEFDLSEVKEYHLRLEHLAYIVSGDGHAPIQIIINDQVVKTFSPPASLSTFSVDELDITEYLKEGKNTLFLEYQQGGITYYCVKKIDIFQK